MAYLPGDYGARAIADVLSGDFNPSGRLPFTWPRKRFSAPDVRPEAHGKHPTQNTTQHAFNPLYTFGSGLSYSTVKHQRLS